MSYDEIAPDVIGPTDGKESLKPLKVLDTVIALYDFPGTQPSHLPLNLGDTIYVLCKLDSGWWDGVLTPPSGDILRGWFPHNYVRSVNYVQPVLNKLKSNKEIDSITAANTAANVLIPSFTSLLQKNLADLEKNSPSGSVRKNSVVSFASSETSIPSDRDRSQEHVDRNERNERSDRNESSASQATARQSLGSLSHSAGSFGGSFAGSSHGSIAGSTSMAGSLAGSMAGSISGSAAGLLSHSPNIIFTSTQEAEKLVEEYKAAHSRNLVWLPRLTTGGDVVFYCDQLNIYCDAIPLAPFVPEIDLAGGSLELPSGDVLLQNPIVPTDSDFAENENEADDGPTARKLFDPLKRDSNASSVQSHTSSGASSYHHFDQPFFAMPGIFLKHTSDLTYWTEVKEKFNYLLDLTFKAVKDDNKNLFSTHFARLTNVVTVVASASRLVHQDFCDTAYEKLIRRKLKRVASSFAQIYINGMLHFSVMHYSSESTGEFLPFFRSTRPSAPSTISSSSTLKQFAVDEDASYFQQIETEVDLLRTNMNSLTKIFLKLTKDKKFRYTDYDGSASDTDDEGEDRYNILPQVYPRFISDEFNGGNWCNPFFVTKNTMLNASGDDLKNRYHLKIIIDKDAYNTIKKSTDEMAKISKETLEFLDPKSQSQYYNDALKSERNHQILRLIYRYLFQAASTIDVIESFDFTVFCLIKRYSSNEESSEKPEQAEQRNSTLTFDYPVVLEFFQFKQQLHNMISNIVMATQSLTVDDPDVFKGMKEEDPLFYNRDILKIPTEKAAMLLSNVLTNQLSKKNGDSISLNTDALMSTILVEGINFFEQILKIIQQLIEERETILNYATRVMHDDFNVQLLLIERNNTIMSEKSEEGHLYYTGKKRSNDIPWYLEGDEEFDLLLDVKGSIKGGTKEALVAHLTHHDLFDSNFNNAFLLTFGSMMTIADLISLLINRFNIEAPEGLSYEEYNTWIAKKQNPIRLRVMNIMKLLVEKHWTQSYYNEAILKRWLKFALSSTVQSFSIGKVLSSNLAKLLKGEIIFREREPSIPDYKPPAPLTKGFSVKKIKLLDIDYVELARQLTLMEFRHYSKITKLACISKVWGKKSGLHEDITPITDFIRASNQLTNYVAFMILRKPDPKKRVQVIRYFVQVAEKCRQYNNFSSMTAIISALYSSPIHRLKKTWRFVSPETLAHLRNMNKLMNSSRNFNEYRDVLKFVGSEPCVPFFGVYLSDLTFVYHGNPDHLLNRPRMINFAKRAKTCEIVLGIDRFKTTGYNLQPVPEIQKYLGLWFDKCPTIEEQYQISLNLEPRDPPQTDASHARGNKSLGTFSFK